MKIANKENSRAKNNQKLSIHCLHPSNQGRTDGKRELLTFETKKEHLRKPTAPFILCSVGQKLQQYLAIRKIMQMWRQINGSQFNTEKINVLQIYIIGPKEIVIDELSTSSLPDYYITGEPLISFMSQIGIFLRFLPIIFVNTTHNISCLERQDDTGNVHEGKNNRWKCAVNALCYSMPFDQTKHQQLLIW